MGRWLLAAAFFVVWTAGGASAQSPEEKGLAIAVEDDKRDSGFLDYQAEMTMILRNRQGEEATRILKTKNLEVENDGDKSLVVFHEPRDVKGTALLNFSHKLKPDDQWLYLPALKRVKRISSANKSGSFMGSEFAYEDITSQEVEKYTYQWIRDGVCGALTCFVFERVPAYQYSGYSKQVVWLDQKEYRLWKIEYYDRKRSLLKTLTYSGYQKYLDRYWYPDKMMMVNHQTGKSTQLIWSHYKFKTGLTPRHFTKNSLQRAR